mmetsp:Transcript_1765/g.5154  ORF Transcript_1765/g.5154 Transcript_1765/m.5154 type:complete len:374 (+) Transcript_1765:107-1228(+)
MGANQSSSSSSAATISSVAPNDKDHPKQSAATDATSSSSSLLKDDITGRTKVLDTPILMDDDEGDGKTGGGGGDGGGTSFPTPTGHEYDLMDRIAADLPSVIDDESRQQVEDYIEACDGGKGPMVACFSMAEYVSLFLRKHQEAAALYENTCFRSRGDKSANGVAVDGTRAYPPACFNLAQMRMTGKGGTRFDRKEGYDLFDRACRAGHGGSCHMMAKMLLSDPGSLGPGVPYDPAKAAGLLDNVCEEGDPISCFTLATMLLRGDNVASEADNVSPMEARGVTDVQRRKNEAERKKRADDQRKALARDPPRAASLLNKGCDRGHAPSCYNLAVMYTQGDDGVPQSDEKAEVYKKKTEEHVDMFGGLGFGGMGG